MEKKTTAIIILVGCLLTLNFTACVNNMEPAKPQIPMPTVDSAQDSMLPVSAGLAFEINATGDGYVVSHIGTCTDTYIVIPAEYEGLPVIGVGESAFAGCEIIKGVVFPDSLIKIGHEAFAGCIALNSVTIGNGVTHIDNSAFYGCTGLTHILIPDSVLCIDNNAFGECTGLTNIVIPDSVESIGWYAFAGCINLSNVVVPDNGVRIGWGAFTNCDNLQYNIYGDCVYLGNANNPYVAFMGSISTDADSYSIHKNTKVIAGGAFAYDPNLIEITIPEGVHNIGQAAFIGCDSLCNITIPSSVKSIDIAAFEDCENLVGVYVADIATWMQICFEDYNANPLKLESDLYADGEKLTGNLAIPDGMTTIGRYAFAKCSGISSVTIPVSVVSIDYEAFLSCDNITDVYYKGTLGDWVKIQISSGNNDIICANITYNYVVPTNG